MVFHIYVSAKTVFQRSLETSLTPVRVQVAVGWLRSVCVQCAGRHAQFRNFLRSMFYLTLEDQCFLQKLNARSSEVESVDLHKLPSKIF